MPKRLLVVACLILALGCSNKSSSSASSSSSSGGATGNIKTVFLILMENHNWADIQGSTLAPYINNTLLPMSAYALNYKGAHGPNGPIHPSEPNYLWLEAGDNFGVANDLPPAFNSQASTAHLVTLLNNAGINWMSYQEDIAADSCPTQDVALYSPKHDPMVFFDDVTSDVAYCKAHHRPYSQLAADLTSNSVARYNFLTPNLCNDMHDDCAGNKISNGDTWLAAQIPLILASHAYQDGGAIFITWDESEDENGCVAPADCPVGMIIISPVGKGAGYTNSIAYTHSSTLKTMQQIFGVTPLLGDAVNATSLSDFFTAYP